MIKVLYSFNKNGFEAEYWSREIAAASNEKIVFFPFNHGVFLNPNRYLRAQLLDNLFFEKNESLLKLYQSIETKIDELKADVLLVDNCPPYHPEFLRNLKIYKALRIADGPISAYDRDFAYLHAYDHVLYHSPAYSREINMEDKLRYCGVKHADFWPLGSFDAMCDRTKSENNILDGYRDIDIIFVGALHLNKMPLLAKIKRVFGRKMVLFGLSDWKKNFYFNACFGFPGWVSPMPFDQYVAMYQRAKIGINIHNRGDYTVGSYRLFDLPANGVMQISDGGEFLSSFFRPDEEIVGYNDAEDLIGKIKLFLSNESARKQIALNGFRRVQKDYRISNLLYRLYEIFSRNLNNR